MFTVDLFDQELYTRMNIEEEKKTADHNNNNKKKKTLLAIHQTSQSLSICSPSLQQKRPSTTLIDIVLS